MAVLVTGGAGFIGSHLIERLLESSAGEGIVCLDDFNDFYDPAIKRANAACFPADRVVVVEQSFCDAAATREVITGYDVRRIVHLGAYGGVRASIEQPLLYEQANVRGTLALLEAARGLPIEKFLLASSSSVYGDAAVAPFREDAPLGAPLSPYAASKQAAELWVATYRRLHGLPAAILRLFSVYGPRVRPDLAIHVFADAITSGRPIPLYGDGSVRRDFTHVSDICEGLLAALDSDRAVGETINLGHNQPASMLELLALLEKELGRKATVERRAAADADAPLTCADLSKAERLLGYRPKISLAEGVRDFARWFLARP